ncbi:hypothetical protein MAPG_02923 [Magnaporthiopsis poae ATCC 64411]|uniref:AAA+ ATPase domain-containing protein n=1 Tax=Magnaporthiopsis poae (strain ATCC 64411 / 73-15) TaxID=644358 RepID=A0A0C4DSN8_MAGP6|nr:hypothetical protein MAPG_02923 [Magnaporthiopsis poae ATCC 64411]
MSFVEHRETRTSVTVLGLSPQPAESANAPESAEAGEVGLTYHVEVVDKVGRRISEDDWPEEFNFDYALSEAKNRGGRLPTWNSTFKLISVVNVNTSSESLGRNLKHSKRRFYDIVQRPGMDPALVTTKLIIQSIPFVDVLESCLIYDPGFELYSDRLEVPEPFALIAHHLDKLQDKKHELDMLNESSLSSVPPPLDQDKRAAARQAAWALDVVLKFMARTLGERMTKERKLHALEKPLCTFRMLWMLLVPGNAVYVRTGTQVIASVIKSVVPKGAGCLSGQSHQLGPYELQLWYLDYNDEAQSVTRHPTSVRIPPFIGEREILSLDVVPCDIWDRMDGGKLRAKLEALGEKWFGLLPGQYGHYEGQLHDGRSVSKFCGRVFIDPVSCFEVCRSQGRARLSQDWAGLSQDRATSPSSSLLLNCATSYFDSEDVSVSSVKPPFQEEQRNASVQRWHKLENIPLSETKRMGKNCDQETLKLRYLLVSKRIKAFVFKTRQWDTIDVEFCEKPKANRTPFDRLVIPESRKNMIRSLVYQYTDRKTRPWSADHIRNKGDGQIFLLHGSPGVGKTFTAECIAELTGKPLLALTCADIGTDEVEMEEKLGKWLTLGHKWGAVLLIDEADVLMEKRQHADLKRNSLVSVFLREIEYYRGILFLTTNRVGQFDDAFISRIHVAIHYDNLIKEERDKVWKQFFTKLEDEKGEEIKILRSARSYVLDDPSVAMVPWNGREIRNAFQTAVALAEYRFLTTPAQEKADGDMAELRAEDLKQVCEMTQAFKKYLTEVHDDYDESGRAALNKLRRDSVGDRQE